SEREKNSIQLNQGQTFTMKCQTADNKKDNFSLFARHPGKDIMVFYDKNTNSFTIEEQYRERVSISGSIQKITMELKDLQLKDSGLYLGQYSKFNLEKNVEEEEEGCAILLHVKEVNKMAATEKVKTGAGASALSEPQILVFALTACTLVIVFGLMLWVCIPK
ncbi:nicotinamide riboside kinase 1 isoform X1, partial [Clarias magur]